MLVPILIACSNTAPAPGSPTGATGTPPFAAIVAYDDAGLIRLSDGADVRDVTAGRRPAWSPDGEWLVFERAGDLWVIRADGTDERAVTSDPAADDKPAWSPDGTQIAFTRDDGASNEIWTVGVDGTDPAPATSLGGYADAPDWGPAGLLFHDEAVDPWVTYAMDAPGGVAEPLLDALVYENDADWAPDGSIVFSGFVTNDNQEIFRQPAPGAPRVRLTDAASDDDEASMSPDGSRILFESDRSGVYDLWVMDPDGGGAQPLIAIPPVTGRQHGAWRP